MSEDDNPLLPSIDVRFNAPWANNDSLAKIEAYVTENENVKEVYYQRSLVQMINKNLRNISIVILGFSLLLLIIAMALINNTIRLSVYSKRFVIRSMQLVGATESFIRRPFVIKGIMQGSISAFVAILMLLGIIEAMRENIPELKLLTDQLTLIYLFTGIIVTGILMSGLSTSVAVSKYLRMKTDKLYG